MDVPTPRYGPGEVLIATQASLVSLGTERSIVELGRKSLIGKARARPDLVRRVVEKARTEGVASTLSQVFSRLDEPLPLGYSSAGVVIATGRSAHRFSVGSRVACIGQGHASHAEIVAVPEMLCTSLPEGTGFDEGAFGMVGAIGLHGIRCAELAFGETVAVIGLGLIGLLSAQMLVGYGCRVVVADLDQHKLDLARKLGIPNVCHAIEELPEIAHRVSDGVGMDAVLLTVAANSADAVHQAVSLVRFRGKIVVVGVADLHPHRNELWNKEATLVVSRAAGAGSLDPVYELDGVDLPPGHVRWTEGRNLEEFIRLVANRTVRPGDIITHRFPISRAEETYGDLIAGRGGPHVGVVFEYPPPQPAVAATVPSKPRFITATSGKPRIGVIGAGMFGRSILLPAAREAGAVFATIATSDGASAATVAQRFGFERHSTDYNEVLHDPNIDGVLILTRHSSHSRLVSEALAAGKHVFVEKPLCISHEELDQVRAVLATSDRILTVGYNRRFASLSRVMRTHFAGRVDPLVLQYRVNAGYVPPTHWVHSPAEGDSRIIGEVCHFVDLMQFLTGAQPVRVFAERINGNNTTAVNNDNMVITIRFCDGSVGVITYSGSGDRAMGRERVEAFADGKSALMDDFRLVRTYRRGKESRKKLMNQDLGHAAELKEFVAAMSTGKAPIPIDDILYSTAAVFEIDASVSSGLPREVTF